MPDNAPAIAMRAIRHLYSLPAVAAFQGGAPLALDWLPVPVTEAQKAAIETGIRRRYTPIQIAEGVAAERYPGLRGA